MTIIKIKNWDRYQHYHNSNSDLSRKNNMVWFKMYADSLQDSSFMQLNSSLKWVFIGLMLLACKTNNTTEMNLKWLQRTLNVRGIEKSLNYLNSIGIIELVYNNPIQRREEKRREEERREEKSEKGQNPSLSSFSNFKIPGHLKSKPKGIL